jgi:DNA gyrase subunit A
MLIGCELTDGTNEVVLVSREGMSVRFKEYAQKVGTGEPLENEAESAEEGEIEATDSEEGAAGAEGAIKEKGGLRDMGRQATGVRGIRLAKNDYVVSLAIVDTSAMLLVASENGIGKRTSFDEYRITERGGKGVITMKTSDKTGKVARALVVHDADELMLMTNSGQSVRIPVNQIREAGRNTQGVKLITLREGELVQDVAKVISDKDENADAPPDALQSPEEGTLPPAREDTGGETPES